MFRRCRPMLKRRGIVLSPYDLHDKWVEWLAEAELNVLGLHAGVSDLIEFARSSDGCSFIAKLDDLGIQIEYEAHAMSWLLPRSEFDAHPEWFRMDSDASRTPDWNLCPSNEEALKVACRNALSLAGILSYSSGRFHLWPDDGKPWCSCTSCRALSASDQNLLVANSIASSLRTRYPRALLGCLSYLNTLDAPAKIWPARGVFLEFAPIRRTYERPLGDPSVPENSFHVQKLDSLLARFASKNAEALEYWLDASRFSKWRKPAQKLQFNRKVLQQDVAFYASRGFGSITSFGVYLDAEYLGNYGPPPISEYGAVLRNGRTRQPRENGQRSI